MHTLNHSSVVRAAAACGVVLAAVVGVAAQTAPAGTSAGTKTSPSQASSTQAKPQSPSAKPATPAPAAAPAPPPADYLIGPDDVLTVIVYKEPTVSGDVTVRPDGKVTLPLVNDVQAAGRTPEELRSTLTTMLKGFFTDPTVTIVVKQINSRRVSITGNVQKPGPYPLAGPMNVLDLISQAGGLAEFAKGKEIVVIRKGVSTPFKVNYDELKKGKNLKQNIDLRPGDTVIVP